jgi:nucleoredoxin
LGAAGLSSCKYVGLYFGAHWAPPCRLFTTNLAEWYPKINADGKVFEVIFVSIDGNADAFERNFAEMPWLAVPYSDEARIASLKQKFGINGIPTLIIVDTNGNLVRAEGREEITKDPAAALEVWNTAKSAQTAA